MSKLTTRHRKMLPKKAFALPGTRKYPIYDKAHAANAKARAEQQFRKGNISKGMRNRIDAAANKVLRRGRNRG